MDIVTLAHGALNVAIKDEVQKFFRKRAEQTTRYIIEELRTARVRADDVEKAEGIAGMCVATYSAMAQGAAFRNLRLIAKVLAHKASDPTDNPDDFLAWIDAIASLTHEEAVFLATLHSINVKAAETYIDLHKQHSFAVAETRRALVGPGKLFATDEDFEGTCNALTRTGFVILVSLASGLSVAPAPRLSKLARMADLQAWADDHE